jgi:ubiquinone/menaquinone biosynthesis C-methylase UbiE
MSAQSNLHSSRSYLPAAGHDCLLPLYDPIVKLLGGEAARRVLLDQAALGQAHRVLDVGCGTGTLATMIKRLYPDIEVVGIDPDPKALARARRKSERARLSIQFDQGFGDELPYRQASFDRVLSSFVFHHLPADDKVRMLRAVLRVLKPGGEFHMLDFERQEDGAHGLLARLLHSSSRLKDNSESRVLSLMRQADFADPRKVRHRAMLFGVVAYYRASA